MLMVTVLLYCCAATDKLSRLTDRKAKYFFISIILKGKKKGWVWKLQGSALVRIEGNEGYE